MPRYAKICQDMPRSCKFWLSFQHDMAISASFLGSADFFKPHRSKPSRARLLYIKVWGRPLIVHHEMWNKWNNMALLTTVVPHSSHFFEASWSQKMLANWVEYHMTSHMGVSTNEGPQNGWLILEHPMKLDDLGSPHFPQLRLLHFSARACITPPR